MPKLTRRSVRYGNGTICESRNGRHWSASIYLAGGERRRARFRDESSAKLWLDSQTAEYKSLSPAQMLDAARAYAMLPDDVTLLDCARFWHASKHATTPISFRDAADKWLETKRVSLRPVTLNWYENMLSRFETGIRDIQSLGDLDRERVVAELANQTPSMRNAMLRVLSAFLSWAVASGYAVANLADGIEKGRTGRPKRAVLDVNGAENLLRACERIRPAAVPYLAVGMFAGIRPHEMRKLSHDDFKNGYIYLGPEVAKTSSERTVPIRPNLAAWLSAYPVSDGVFTGADITLTRTLRKLCREVGIVDRKDILRHSYASYAYELTGDAAKVAAELGHTDTSMLFRHYRGVVPPGSGSKFFSIMPSRVVAQTLPKKRTKSASNRT